MSPLNSISVFLMKFAYCHEQLNMRFKFKKRASFLQLLVRALQFQNLNKGHDLLVTIFLSFSFRTGFFLCTYLWVCQAGFCPDLFVAT